MLMRPSAGLRTGALARGILALGVLLGCWPTLPGAQTPCGGVERWAVKVGADPGITQVDLTALVSTGLHNLISLTRPSPLPTDETTRHALERTVRVVDGRLAGFKLESGRDGDQDFHLVITDDTLQFSPGGPGTQPVPHSFVAEIVNPACVGGRHGQTPTPSHIQAQLQTVYDRFRQQFPVIGTSGLNEGLASGMPVRVTGITFYDRPHFQTGRAMNGVEIHPVLDLVFNPTPVGPPVPPVTTTIAMVNPGFEQGAQGWTATQGVITTDSNEPARTGQGKAWLGGYGVPHTDTLSQSVALPGNVTAGTLEFYLHISTEEIANETFDRLRVRVRAANGQFLATLRTYTNQQAAPGFALQTFNLNAYRGRTIRIELSAQEDNGKMTSFVVDDFRIVVE